MTVLELENIPEENLLLYMEHMSEMKDVLNQYGRDSDIELSTDMDVLHKIVGLIDTPNFQMYYIDLNTNPPTLHTQMFQCESFHENTILDSEIGEHFIIYMRTIDGMYRGIKLNDVEKYLPFSGMRFRFRENQIDELLTGDENS